MGKVFRERAFGVLATGVVSFCLAMGGLLLWPWAQEFYHERLLEEAHEQAKRGFGACRAMMMDRVNPAFEISQEEGCKEWSKIKACFDETLLQASSSDLSREAPQVLNKWRLMVQHLHDIIASDCDPR